MSTKVFNALTGEEIKKIILREVSRGLDQVPDLKQHITFPVVRWSWKAHLEVYPRDPKDIKVEVGDEIISGMEPPDSPPKLVVIKGSRTVEAPDAVREMEELGVPTPMRTGVGTADVFLQPRDSSEAGRGRGAVVDRRAGDRLAAIKARGVIPDVATLPGVAPEMSVEVSDSPDSPDSPGESAE